MTQINQVAFNNAYTSANLSLSHPCRCHYTPK